MTLNWTLTKIGIGIGLGAVSSNPVGWAIGLTTSQLIKLKSKENLNSSTLTLSDKEEAQRWIEIANDYQIGVGLGILGKGLGAVASEMANRTATIGKEAGKEIAQNGGNLNNAAKELISKGQKIAKWESNLRMIPNLQEAQELVNSGVELFKESIQKLKGIKDDKEFIRSINLLVNDRNVIIDEIENELNERKNELNDIRENTLELNKANVEFLIKYELNREEHRNINRRINEVLIRIKAIQLNLHNNDNCCEECRFC